MFVADKWRQATEQGYITGTNEDKDEDEEETVSDRP